MKNYTAYNDAASRAMVDMFRRALAPAMEVAAPDWLLHHVEIVRNPHGFQRDTDDVEIRLVIRPIGSVRAVPDKPLSWKDKPFALKGQP